MKGSDQMEMPAYYIFFFGWANCSDLPFDK